MLIKAALDNEEYVIASISLVNVALVITMQSQHIDRLVQERCNSIVNTLELCLSCTNPSIWNMSAHDPINQNIFPSICHHCCCLSWLYFSPYVFICVECMLISLQWLHNERDGVSNQQPYDCLLNSLFRRRLKKTSKLCITGLCEGNSVVAGEFPAQRASNAENVSIWWRHHVCHCSIWLK